MSETKIEISQFETLQDKCKDELERIYRLTVEDKLQWDRVIESSISIRLNISNDIIIIRHEASGEYCLLIYKSKGKAISLIEEKIDICSDLIGKIYEYVMHQHEMRDQYNLLMKILPKLQLIK